MKNSESGFSILELVIITVTIGIIVTAMSWPVEDRDNLQRIAACRDLCQSLKSTMHKSIAWGEDIFVQVDPDGSPDPTVTACKTDSFPGCSEDDTVFEFNLSDYSDDLTITATVNGTYGWTSGGGGSVFTATVRPEGVIDDGGDPLFLFPMDPMLDPRILHINVSNGTNSSDIYWYKLTGYVDCSNI